MERERNLVRLSPEGELTIYHVAELKAELLSGMQDDPEVEIKLSAVSEMDTAGFQLLVFLKREAIRSGKTLRLVAHSQATLEVIDSYNMASYFGDPVVITR
ncbi:MAG: STAS domain-containing protein [Sideroxydans sp.]|nr:STAS domain-containing protein [Sideroxydans sp.]